MLAIGHVTGLPQRYRTLRSGQGENDAKRIENHGCIKMEALCPPRHDMDAVDGGRGMRWVGDNT